MLGDNSRLPERLTLRSRLHRNDSFPCHSQRSTLDSYNLFSLKACMIRVAERFPPNKATVPTHLDLRSVLIRWSREARSSVGLCICTHVQSGGRSASATLCGSANGPESETVHPLSSSQPTGCVSGCGSRESSRSRLAKIRRNSDPFNWSVSFRC